MKPPSVKDIVRIHGEFRDHIADTIHGEHVVTLPGAYGLIFIKSVGYCYNTFKAIGLLLPELYYEQATALVRILWEAAANLAWVAREPLNRAKVYAQFTVVERRKFLQMRVTQNQRLGAHEAAARFESELRAFDEAFESILADYRVDKKKRNKFRARFSSPSLEDVINDLGEPWLSEYRERYPLWCFYTHASPGVVLFPNPAVPKVTKKAFEGYDQPRTIQVALWSMAIMERVHRLMCSVISKTDDMFFDQLDDRISFRITMRHPDIRTA